MVWLSLVNIKGGGQGPDNILGDKCTCEGLFISMVFLAFWFEKHLCRVPKSYGLNVGGPWFPQVLH
jgi:hypothetical protein